MLKKVTVALVVVLAICLAAMVSVSAQDKLAGTPAAPAKAPAKTAMHKMAVNTVAVCACGRVFVPDANTKYIAYNGKEYACCSDPCHQKASTDPAAAAKAFDDNKTKLLTEYSKPAEAPKQ